MYEVDFTGWVREPETLERVKKDRWYRWKLHWRRVWVAIKIRRWWFFNWDNMKALLLNEDIF